MVATAITMNSLLATIDPIELAASLLGIAYLALQYRANTWMWVFSLLMSMLYTYVNFAHALYANTVLQLLFTIMAIIGLARWGGLMTTSPQRPITSMPRRQLLPLVLSTLLLFAATYIILHLTGESPMPIFDSLTTAINITGTYMLIRRYYQEWICWMIVDPLMAIMYTAAGMWPSAILYTLFSIVVVFGYRNWRRMAQTINNHSSHKEQQP